MSDVIIKQDNIGKYYVNLEIRNSYNRYYYQANLYEQIGGQFVMENSYVGCEKGAKAAYTRYCKKAKERSAA